MNKRPNILLILNDDMGFSDIGCYGGEVDTPNLNALAENGLKFTQFYNTARCCPSRASLLTGLHPHQANIGHMVGNDGIEGYLGDLSLNSVTIAEALKLGGYNTYMSGKWHVTRFVDGPKHNWPCQRGFDDFYGLLKGAANYYHPTTLARNNERIEPSKGYYITDAITDNAIRQIKEHKENSEGNPFFQYVAYTAPHWPLHAHPEDIEKYKGRFDSGWDTLRKKRLERMVNMGIIEESWELSPRDPSQPAWDDAEHKAWESRRMEVYAAQIDRMDQGIGRIIENLKSMGEWDNTLILFLADNGGCAEGISDSPEFIKAKVEGMSATYETWDGEKIKFGNHPNIMPGAENTYQSYGVAWANLSNTPFRLYKHWVHEGGIATPLIVHWPDSIEDKGSIRHQPAQLPDIMATCLDAAGIDYPKTYDGRVIKPLEGYSMAPIFGNKPNEREALYWEHEGNRAIRRGKWKLVSKYPKDWELYNMDEDRTEMNDLASKYPEVVDELANLYEKWARRCNVMPWDDLNEIRKKN